MGLVMGYISEVMRSVPQIQLTDTVKVRTGVSKKSGEPYKLRQQDGYLCSVDENGVELRQRLQVTLQGDQAPYMPGYYLLGASAFSVSQYGDITLDRYQMTLVPLGEQFSALIAKDSER